MKRTRRIVADDGAGNKAELLVKINVKVSNSFTPSRDAERKAADIINEVHDGLRRMFDAEDIKIKRRR
jgi:hypothetical protein